ncbi:response regulator [Desulfonema ishimotonii]|uniref:Response regulator n=1 Tax=Desulfonema ishimotonii TaxID=45657 RepID=A0A401FWC8_9BACT|nr:response regulator [Desulfonema ishimotonii]GBC61244.1 response regulator [Desulfonema ishimotonii]
MSAITIFSSIFCRKESVVRTLADKTGYHCVSDKDIIARAAELSGMKPDKIQKAFSAKTSVFNNFTHEKERTVAWLRLALAEILTRDNMIIDGFSSQLIPREISHVLRVCLIADMKSRVRHAGESRNLAEKEARHQITREDENRAAWIYYLSRNRDPWDPSLYDIILPTDKTGQDEMVKLIEENLRSEIITSTDASRKAAQDFILAARTEVALAREGHNIGVCARDGAITLTINKNVLMLNRLEDELKAIAGKIEGIRSVETRIGKGYHKTDIYRKYDFEVPKLLLVDDEREFVQTLSERLLMRNMGSAVAYDGESALNLISEDEPEVMILDLKMPGIDGIEVLRQVKETQPDIEVIILTGHGSEKDRELCMSLGAFAYLQKPVNIEELSAALREANRKIRERKNSPQLTTP